jgi:tRNA pseudouridine38-40 synthase
MSRIALGLEYDGTDFAGWQSQHDALGIQTVVEKALSAVADHPVAVVAAGRTDAGVHAAMQVVHFDTTATRNERSWMLGGASHLPPSVSILWARDVPDSFHARFSAQARSYRYVILNRGPRPAIAWHRTSWVRDPLDVDRMQQAGALLVGQHDFSSFRAAECQAHSPIRHLYDLQVSRKGQIVELAVTANAFLHHMVRNIAGVLIAVGRGDRPVSWVNEVLEAKDRRQGGVTAPAGGLYLSSIHYPAAFGLPSQGKELVIAI